MTIDVAKLETRLFINNEFVNSSSGKTFATINPATEEVICNVQEAGPDDVNRAVDAAEKAFGLGSAWRSMDGTTRRDILNKIADLVERDSDYLSELESLDNGKPIGSQGQYGSKVDIGLVMKHFRFYAGWADKLAGKTVPVEGNNLCYTRREAVGVCACIVPWNFPLAMLAWKVAPALCCGNTVILKSSEKTPLTAIHFAKLVAEAGLPPGVFNLLSGFGSVGEALVLHPKVQKIAFTGSTAVGKRIQSLSSKNGLKRVSLELGGKSPLIVLDDADIEQAVEIAHVGLFLDAGQCCVASSRLFVQESVYDKFVAAAVAKAKSIKIGDLDDAEAEQGPQVDKIQFDKILDYIESGKNEGAKCVTGGNRYGKKGFFIEPTVFTEVSDDMKIFKEEIFGPVMSITKFKTDVEVVERANNTRYGLAAGICSKSSGRALGMANQLRAGTVWVNSYDVFDSAMPFGGYGESGIGRDKGEDGLEAWMETKCILLPLDGTKC
mmetsp:Transcript_60666/g.148803  ORF Transcript_60666/g.148803 Transcript_60666/m.148803 type:complete len:494 (-) Transcript_60666:11-1492(-)